MTSRIGSVQWTAPEVLRQRDHNEKVDTFSFAMLLYEMWGRKPPYSDSIERVEVGLITGMLNRPLYPQGEGILELPQEVWALIQVGLIARPWCCAAAASAACCCTLFSLSLALSFSLSLFLSLALRANVSIFLVLVFLFNLSGMLGRESGGPPKHGAHP